MQTVSVQDSYRLYLHYLAKPGRSYITFREWKVQEQVETITDERTKRLIKLTGYPGGTTVEEVIEWVKGKLDEIWKFLDGIYNTIANAVNAALDTVWEWIKNAYQVIANVVNSIVGWVATFATTITTLIKKIGDWITGVFEWIETQIVNVVTTVSRWIYDTISSIIDAINAVIIWVGDKIETAIAWMRETISSLTATIWEWIKDFGQRIADTVNAIAADVWEWFKHTYTTISDVIDQVGVWFDAAIETVGRWITDQAKMFEADWNDMINQLRSDAERLRADNEKLWSFDTASMEEQLTALVIPIIKMQLKMSELLATGVIE